MTMPRRKPSKRTNPRKLHDAALRIEKQSLREIEREAEKLRGPLTDIDGDDMIETVDSDDDESD